MAEREEQMIRGTVRAIVFQNHENGYSVLRLCTEAGEMITVVGIIPMTLVGERLVIAGKWGYHPSHGQQFEAEFLERLMPETTTEILSYLSSRAVRGIGARMAAKIVERFGAESLNVLENEPEKLAQISGISLKKAEQMSESFRRQSGIRRLIEFLTLHHLPCELAVRLYRVYGELAKDALRDDPYLLTDRYFGAGFPQVDAFALELDVAADDEHRVEAGILFELSFNLNNGHTFIPAEKLLGATAMLLNLPTQTVEEGMQRLQEQERLKTDTIANIAVCYLPEYYEAEVYITERISAMSRREAAAFQNADGLIAGIESARGIWYAQQQKQAIRSAAENRILIVTGGPGTGKTTVICGILDLFEQIGVRTLLAAPTGRAAKRISECTGRSASTIHRLLEAQFDEQSGEMTFFHNEDEPLDCDAVILDEVSMVDVLLMSDLLRALKPGCRLILVGDPDQLPSVGAGNLFSDLIRSERVHTVRLTEIFRQAQQSLIVMNAHAVNRGELPVLTARDRDFFFMKRRTADALVQTVCELCAERLPEKMGIPVSEIQVLSPTRKGETGTRSLNLALQAVLNPPEMGKREKKYGEFIFREGDRVMQIRNNYDILWKRADAPGSGSGIFNGDIGIIEQIDYETELVTIRFDERVAEYAFDMLGELEPAYAMTVHKSQGSEYRAVIFCAFSGAQMLLTRSVLYTAITRARELLIVVGNEQIVAAMTANDRQQRRYSGLKLRLQGDAPCD